METTQVVDISYPAEARIRITLDCDRRNEGVIEVHFDPPLSKVVEQSGIPESTIFAAVITKSFKMVAECTGMDPKDLAVNNPGFPDMIEIIPQKGKSFPEAGSEGRAGS